MLCATAFAAFSIRTASGMPIFSVIFLSQLRINVVLDTLSINSVLCVVLFPVLIYSGMRSAVRTDTSAASTVFVSPFGKAAISLPCSSIPSANALTLLPSVP